MTTQIAVRLPDAQLEAIDAIVPTRHKSRSEVIRRAIEFYLYRLACEQDAAAYEARPFDDGEMILADDPTAWNATPAW
ncbi:MAG: ribbon-helix-helix domain-containing protein [Acidimicrobiales bacterium]